MKIHVEHNADMEGGRITIFRLKGREWCHTDDGMSFYLKNEELHMADRAAEVIDGQEEWWIRGYRYSLDCPKYSPEYRHFYIIAKGNKKTK